MRLIPTSVQPVTITLYRGVPFNNKYIEHTLLSNQFKFKAYSTSEEVSIGQDKENFLNMRKQIAPRPPFYIFPRTTKTGTFNFAFGNGLVTAVTMELDGDEINSNYMKVNTTNNNTDYYYFITGITQKNESIYILNLELDVFMTFSEEFITSMNSRSGKPVMVERKHCRRMFRNSSGVNKPNEICSRQESTFKGIRSDIVDSVDELSFIDYNISGHNYNTIMGELKWYYILVGTGGETGYRENHINYPYDVHILPSEPLTLIFDDGGETTYSEYINSPDILSKYIGNPNVIKIVVSPFPPFAFENTNVYFYTQDGSYKMHITDYSRTEEGYWKTYSFSSSDIASYGSRFILSILRSGQTPPSDYHNTLALRIGYGGIYTLSFIRNIFSYTNADVINSGAGFEIDDNEFKLQIAPFKRKVMSSYYGNEYEVPLNLKLYEASQSTSNISSNNSLIPFVVASTNPETNSYFNFVGLNKSVEAKRGVSNSVAYNFPTSTDAQQLYNLTQKNQYETAKSNATLSNGFKIVASTLTGGLMGNIKGATQMITGVGSGIIGEIENIERYNAKMSDLATTPDKYSFGGSSLPFDNAMSYGSHQNIPENRYTLLPYIVTYKTDDITYKMACEFLYHYGYEYNNESYFATTITMESDNIFERRMFNYVKLREDITSKLVSNEIPLIVAQKMNEVLNAGITFWTFFAFDLTTNANVDKALNDYFQKTKYCNAEVGTSNIGAL